jgi:hypothetical protein
LKLGKVISPALDKILIVEIPRKRGNLLKQLLYLPGASATSVEISRCRGNLLKQNYL